MAAVVIEYCSRNKRPNQWPNAIYSSALANPRPDELWFVHRQRHTNSGPQGAGGTGKYALKDTHCSDTAESLFFHKPKSADAQKEDGEKPCVVDAEFESDDFVRRGMRSMMELAEMMPGPRLLCCGVEADKHKW